MQNYKKIKEVGSGTFAVVYSALHEPSGEIVAVKELKRKFVGSWEECLNLPEIRFSKLEAHPNVVQLKKAVKKSDSVSLVYELMDCDLRELMLARKTAYTETQVRNICFQILQGLAYMHKKGYFHRDLKPENLLFKQGKIKICDFDSVVEINPSKPLNPYNGTQWYRAPELLLGSRFYGPQVDMWSMGAIMAELFEMYPLFLCQEHDLQFYQICRVIGNPTSETWPEGISLLSRQSKYVIQRCFGSGCLATLIKSASDSALELIASLCSWDPLKRPTAAEALQHPFFVGSHRIPRSFMNTSGTHKLKRDKKQEYLTQ